MLGDVTNNPDLLKEYDKDKEQLKYEKEILEVLKNNHIYLKYIHPAILLKNSKIVIEEFGNSPKYLKYLPPSIINKYQDILYEYSKKIPRIFKFINYNTQIKNIDEVLIYIKSNPINYDYLDIKIKKDNKELFYYCFDKLFDIKDVELKSIYYEYSINNPNLLHSITEVLLDKELVIILNGSLERIIRYRKLVSKLEIVYKNKSKYKIFKYLLSLYKNNEYIENYFDRVISIIDKDYYLFENNRDVIRLNYDLFTLLSEKELTKTEIKRLYYLLNTKFLHINNIDEYYNLDKIRTNLLDNYKLDSIKDYKRVLFEYRYCMSYEDVSSIIDKYSNSLNDNLNKYKKFKYKLDEIEEYEALITLKEMIDIKNTNNIKDLKEYLRDTLLTYKESKSLDVLIYLEDILNNIENKELIKSVNKKSVYTKEEYVLYEDVVSKNKQQKDFIGKKILVKYIDSHTDINLLLGKVDDNYNSNRRIEDKSNYIYIKNDYLPLSSDDIYTRVSNINKYQIRSNKDKYIINDDSILTSIVCIDKINIKGIKMAVEQNVPLEIIPVKLLVGINNKKINSLYKKILHYINPDNEYVIDYYKNITPINCIPIMIELYNNLYLSKIRKTYNRATLTDYINNILDELEKIDNSIIRKQTINMIYSVVYKDSIVACNKKSILRNIDKLSRKYKLYKRDTNTYQDYYVLLDTNLKINKKYNKNQLEFVEIKDKINIDKINKYVKILKENSSNQDIPTIIRYGAIANILTLQVYPSILNLAMLSVMFYRIGYIPKVDRCGDYSASLVRNIFKNKLSKDDLNLVCATIDYVDSKEDIIKIKSRYRIKDIDRFEELTYIVKDILLLDSYHSKKDFHYKKTLRLFKVNDTIKEEFIKLDIDKYIMNNIISKMEYEELSKEYSNEEILKLCEK